MDLARAGTLLTEFLELGGPVVALLLVISVVALGVILWKLWQFVARGVGRRAGLEEALQLWDAGRRDATMARTRASKSHLRTVMIEAMEAGDASDRFAERAEARAEENLSNLEGGFRLLDSIAQVSPLLGLFGTVLGMIQAFQQLQGAGASVDPSILAGGIWVALLTTAVGLAVAMPVSLILTWLESRVARERVFIDKALQMLLCPADTATEAHRAAAE
ncbi:MAG: MotA/TolQ/ExbB proton channel family protein [Pseudomonadota bacterium]